jgi:hypothetical protein
MPSTSSSARHNSRSIQNRVLHATRYISRSPQFGILRRRELQHLHNSRFASIRVPSNSSSYSWEFMLADQHLHEIQFTFPSLPIRVFHASAPEIQFAFPSNSTFFEFMRSSSRYNLRSLQFQFEASFWRNSSSSRYNSHSSAIPIRVHGASSS